MVVNFIRRTTRIILFLIFSMNCMMTGFPQSSVVKHALVVGIGKYSPASEFRPISADNDVRIIMKLLRQQGFTDTLVLLNEQATKSGFLQACQKLRENIKPGDIVFIHFSTHGQQLEDNSGDEIDGLDEAIALYDARSRCSVDYKGENHLTDDELGRLIEGLRKNLGKDGDILVMIDACHSGNMTRGVDTVILRGGYPPLMIKEGTPEELTRGGDKQSGTKNAGNSKSDEKQDFIYTEMNQMNHGDLANYVIFSACENNEVSSEFCYSQKYFGPLTWAFLNALLNNSSENYTYNKLYHDIRYEMISMFENYKTRQNPTMEAAGEGEDKVIFGGEVVRQQKFFTINKFIAPDKVVMSAGNISGIFDSTAVEVYPSGTLEPGKLGTKGIRGIVTDAGYMESVVQLESPLTDTKPGNHWIFIAKRRIDGYKVAVNLGAFTNTGLKNQVISELTNLSFVVLKTESPEFILEQKKNKPDEMVLILARNMKLYRDKIKTENLGTTMIKIAQVHLLKNLKVSAPEVSMEIMLLPSDTIHCAKSKFQNEKTMRNSLRENVDTAMLVIENTGRKEFYFNLVDIDPEDNFSVILPNKEVSISDCFLQPGKKFRKIYVFQKPYGTETLKFFVSGRKFDLRPVFSSAEKSRGVGGDVETLFGFPGNAMRGTSSGSFDLATFTYYFDIIK